MHKPRVLAILNPGRFTMLAGQLERLRIEGTIETWVGLCLVPLRELGPEAESRYGKRLFPVSEFPRLFRTYANAADFAEQVSRRHPSIDFGRIYSAEKYPERLYPGGLADYMNLFAGLESLIEAEQLNTAFSDYPASSADLMAYFLLQALGGRTLYFIQSRVGPRLVGLDSLDRPKSEIAKRYAEYSGRPLSAADSQRAQSFLAEFRDRKAKPVYFVDPSHRLGKVERLREILSHPLASLKSWRRGRLAARARRGVRFHAIDTRDRIVFFPIQYAPEASVLVRAPAWRDQAAAVSQVAMGLPAGFTLYVKDHPRLARMRDEEYYRRLSAFPNVKLVPYDLDTHEILRVSMLTVTLSGTPGLESLFYGVPVLLLGGADTAYQDFQGVLKLGRRTLGEAIRRALRLEITDAHRQAMALAFLGAGMPGRFNDPRWDSSILSPENTEALHAFFTRLLSGRGASPPEAGSRRSAGSGEINQSGPILAASPSGHPP